MKESKKLKKLCSSNRRLYETIEIADPNSCDSDLLEKALDQVFDKLQQCIKWYKAPSEESKKAVQSGKIKWNNKEKSLDANQIEFVTSLSKILLLDHIQCYGVLHEYLRSMSMSKSTFEYSEENLNEILQFYFDDRKCLLNCVSSLFRNSDDENHGYYKVSVSMTEKLLQKGFLSNIENLNILLRDLTPPKDMDTIYSLKWQEEWIEEQYICLEIMFLIYYSRVSCDAKQLCNLLKMFNISQTNLTSSNLSENGRKTSLKCTYLNTLIIIECLNLESIIEGYTQSKENGISPTDTSLNELVAMVSTLGTLPFHGPILLAFAVLFAFWNSNVNTNIEWRSFANKSVRLAPIQFLCKFFNNNLFQDDPSITGYKSVIKGFISALLTTFNVNYLTEYDNLTTLYTEIFQNEIGLTHQFWEVDYSNENLRSLVDTEKCKFPVVNNQLLPIVLSLVTDLDTSRTAFMYLQEFSLFSQPLDIFLKYCDNSSAYSILSNTIEGVSRSYIQLHQNVSIYDGIVLPMNSVGELYTSLQDLVNSSHGSKLQEFSVLNDSLNTIIAPPSIHESHFIQWKLDYSAWFYFIIEIDSLNKRLLASLQISMEQLQTVNNIITLIDNIINFDHNLTVYIEDHIKDFAGITEDSGPVKSKLLPRLFKLVEQLSYSRYNAEAILSGCVRCITSYSKNVEFQSQVWYLVKQHQLFSFGASNQSTSLFHYVLNSFEVSIGNYTITLAMLDLLSNLLSCIQSTDISSQSIANEFTYGIEYVRSYIFSSYDTWRYSKLIEKFQIGTKILQLFHNIILDASTTSNPLKACRDSLLISLFTDSSVYTVLLNALVYGKQALVELFRLHKLKEGHALETLISSSFDVLKTMLSIRIRHLEKSQQYDLIPLEQYIFSSNIVVSTNKTLPLLSVIASYIDNQYSPIVSQLSVDIIALLSQLPSVMNKDSNSLGANSLVGYLDNQNSNFFTVLNRKLKDSKENFALKLSIIQLLNYSVLHQPGITHLVFSVSGDKAKDKYSVTETLIHNIKHIPTNMSELQLQSQFLNLLHNLWKNTPQYMSIVNSIRVTHKHLWEWLFKILALKPSSKDRGILYQIVSHNSILKILSYELYYNSSSLSPDLLDLLKNNISNIQYSWLNTYLSIPLPIEKKYQLETYSNQIKIDLTTYLIKSSLSMQTTPLYNTAMVQRKLHLLPTDVIKEIESLLEENNQLFTYCDSLVELLKSYNTFFQLVISNKIAKSLSPDSVQEFIKSILTRMIDNIGTQGNLFEDIRYQESYLVQVLTSFWKSLLSSSGAINGAGVLEVLDLFKTLYQLTESWNPNENLLSSLLTSTLILAQNLPQPSSTSLLPTLMGYASKFLAKPQLVRLNLNLLNSLLQNYSGPSEPVLSLLQTREFFTKIIFIMSHLLQDYPKYNYAESLFELLLTLSNNNLFGEYLAINGIMKLYSNDSYPLFNDCKSAYNVNNERNLAHKLWCLSLSIITQMIRTLRHSEHFVDQCIEFVVIHHQRIINILSSTNNITLAYLEELERITALLYELSNYIERFKLHYTQISISIYQKQIVLTLQNCILLLLQPSLISRYAHPMSSIEKELPTEEIIDSTSLQLGSITTKITFPQYIEYSLLKVLRNCSNIVRNITPNLTGSNLKDEAQLWVPLFIPQLEITTSSPSLGVLVGILNTCFATLRKLSAVDQPSLVGDKNPPKIRASEISHLLIFIIQTILYITLQYLVSITRSQSVKNKIKEELCIEIETFMGRFNKDLARIIQSTSTSQKEKLINHFKDVESYIKNL